MARILGRGRTRQRQDGMNKMEARYAAYLDVRMRDDDDVLRWDYQPERLVLAKNTQYTPDFRLVMGDGLIEFHEVKGHWEDDARVKIKLVAELHPYIFRTVRWGRDATHPLGGWLIEEVVP